MNSQGLRRSPRLAELAAKKAAQNIAPKAPSEPACPPKPTIKDILTKESLSALRMRGAMMGLLYKNALPYYQETVSLICWTIDMLWDKTDAYSVEYREYLYRSLQEAVSGPMFFHPDIIKAVKKNGASISESARRGSEIMNTVCKVHYTTNLKGYIEIVEYFLDNPILISQRAKFRHSVLDRVKHLEKAVEGYQGEKKKMGEEFIKKAYAVLTLLPLRDDFKLV
jgi:hypothetical protein